MQLREEVGALGRFAFQEARGNVFVEWLELPQTPVPLWLSVLLLITSALLAGLFILTLDRALPWSQSVPWMMPCVAVHVFLAWHFRANYLRWFPQTRALGKDLQILRQGCRVVQPYRFHSAKLAKITTRMQGEDLSSSLRRLEWLLGALVERDKEWFYLPSRALAVGAQLFLAIERWRIKHGRALEDCLAAWGEFESLLALSGFAYEHPEHCWPTFAPGQAVFEAEELGHPLLTLHTCVRNDFILGEHARFYVLSGSNMAGKSTFLRAVGLNAVLAYAGAPACARSLNLGVFALCASISVTDSLLQGKSKFLAEVERLRTAVLASHASRKVLFLVDELLSGTNSRDRRVAAEAILRALVENGAIGVLSTHDLALTELPDALGVSGRNIHMCAAHSSDPLAFDYLLKMGVTTETNALAIARLAGVKI